MIVQSWTAAPGLTPAQVAAKQQTQPGLAVAVAASTKAAPEVRRETYVFAAPPASAASALAMDDATNANDREAKAARAVAEGAEEIVPSLLPPPRRDLDDPTTNFIPEPKPLVGPPPARLPLLGFDVGGNAALEEAQRLAQATNAYRGQRMDAPPTEGRMEPAFEVSEPDQTIARDSSRGV